MTDHESAPDVRNEKAEQVINEAIASLDAYNSPRTIEKNAEKVKGKTYEISLPDRKLTFIGTEHTTDPNSEIVVRLREDIKDFTGEGFESDKAVFMVEGREGIDRDKLLAEMADVNSVEDAVRKFGESGVAAWRVKELAQAGVNVEVRSPELSDTTIAEHMKSEGSSPEDIAAYLALRQLTTEVGGRKTGEFSVIDIARQFYHIAEASGSSWVRDLKSQEELGLMAQNLDELSAYAKQLSEQFLEGLRQKTGISMTLEDLQNRKVSSQDMKTINELHDPLDAAGQGSEINKVSAKWNGERDKHLVEEIGKAMAAGKKPYVIFGASHATHIEPALLKLAEIAK